MCRILLYQNLHMTGIFVFNLFDSVSVLLVPCVLKCPPVLLRFTISVPFSIVFLFVCVCVCPRISPSLFIIEFPWLKALQCESIIMSLLLPKLFIIISYNQRKRTVCVREKTFLRWSPVIRAVVGRKRHEIEVIYIISSKLHPNSRIDVRLQICDANLVVPSAGFEPLLFSDIYGTTYI